MEENGDKESLKICQMPLSVVPMTKSQLDVEFESAASVNVLEAVESCNCIKESPTAVPVNGSTKLVNGSQQNGEFQLPKVHEITDILEFKNRVLFPK